MEFPFRVLLIKNDKCNISIQHFAEIQSANPQTLQLQTTLREIFSFVVLIRSSFPSKMYWGFDIMGNTLEILWQPQGMALPQETKSSSLKTKFWSHGWINMLCKHCAEEHKITHLNWHFMPWKGNVSTHLICLPIYTSFTMASSHNNREKQQQKKTLGLSVIIISMYEPSDSIHAVYASVTPRELHPQPECIVLASNDRQHATLNPEILPPLHVSVIMGR